MNKNNTQPLYCNNIGGTADNPQCCYPNTLRSPACQEFLGSAGSILDSACPSNKCAYDCQNVSVIYRSLVQDNDIVGDGQAPVRKFRACAVVPSLVRYTRSAEIDENVFDAITKFMSPDTTDPALTGITSAVTDCLSTTCRRARHRPSCWDNCAPVKLLVDNTTPNVQGIHNCLRDLCGGGYKSLPFADADIVGIGVFTSYIMQCAFVFFLLVGFLFCGKPWQSSPAEKPARKVVEERPGPSSRRPQPNRHQKALRSLLEDFHKAQCYFSGTLQVAALGYGISKADMLITFMFIPLAINGIVPIIFSYLLLFRYAKPTLDHTLLSFTCWLLASVVYWILYSNLIVINSRIDQYRTYAQFMFKLSAIPACGGYSALAACPDNMLLGRKEILRATHKLVILTPILWTFSTLCLFVLIGLNGVRWSRAWHKRNMQKEVEMREMDRTSQEQEDYQRLPAANSQEKPLRVHSVFDSPAFWNVLFWLTCVCFVVGVGLQLSLLSIATSLNMMDRTNWTFGQVVAVTIWAPPVLGWAYAELKGIFLMRLWKIENADA